MTEFHSLLKRQLRRFPGKTNSFPEEQTDLLRAINDAYLQFDADRKMLEHSLELTSQELLQANAELSRNNIDLELRVAARTAELSSSEARFRGLFEDTPVSIWEEDFSAVRQYVDDLRGSGVADFSAYFDAHPEDVAKCASRVKIVDVNRATLEMYEAESKAQLLADLSRVLGPESLIPFKEELLALARGETSFENETINYTLRGEKRVVFVRLTVAPGYEETWAKVFVVINDITERRQAEAALAAERDLLQALMDNIPDLIYFKDTASRFTRINRAQAKFLGLVTPEQATGKTDLDFQDPALAQSFYEEEQRLVQTGESLINRIEFNPTPDGQPRWFSTTKVPIKDEAGRVIGIVGVSHDITKRRQAEVDLAAERDLLQALMDNIPDTIYFKDTSSRFTRINRAQARVLGLTTPEQAIGKTDLDFFHTTELAQSFYEEEQRLVQTGEPLINRIEFNPTPDGQPRWFSATKVPVKDETGYVTGIVGVSRDVTERRQAEEARHESEETTRLIIDTALDAVVTIDQDGQITRWNDQAEAIFGWRRAEAVGQRLSELIIPPELRANHERGLKHYSETGEGPVLGKRIEITAQRRNGNIFPVELTIHVLKVNNKVSFAAFIRDITERKQAEEALRQSEERFKLMAWATIDAVWDWDLQTNQIWWGEALQKVFHYPSETTQTNPEWRLDHIHPEDRAKVNRAIDQALEGGLQFWSKEYRFQRKDETYADIMDRGYIIRDDMGKPYRMIGAMMDITERKYMELTLRRANEQMGQFVNELQRRNREVALLNEMSHLLQACQSTEDAYRIIADLSNQLFPHTTGALYLVNTSRTLASAIASWGELSAAERMFAPDDCRALRSGLTHPLSEDDQTVSRCLHLAEPLPAVSYCLPMQAQGEVLGVLHVQARHEEDLDEAKRQLAYTVVEQAGMAVANLTLREALREQSIRDPLTGLYNRRYMEEVLKQQLSRVTRQLHPLGIIMIDIDHFKNFNDTYGHAAGDALLRELGKFLQSHIRGEDIACRYGGEEFTLIMPDASLEVAQQRAEHLRQEARQLRLRHAGQSHEGITLSAGVAIYPQHGRTIETVLRAADDALYRAKQEGRDRVIPAEKAY